MIKFKQGVDIKHIQPETALAIPMCYSVYQDLGYQHMTVTSVADGKHTEKSFHYKGLAFDVRLPEQDTREASTNVLAVQMLRICLGRQFDIVLETDHIHIEFDPE